MPYELDEHGQPIGLPVVDWTPPTAPSRAPLHGRFCRMEGLDADRHAADLFAANQQDVAGENWTYLAYGPFNDLPRYQAWLRDVTTGDDPLFYAIVDAATNKAVGVASYLRIDPAHGVIEVGHINYSPLLQRTPAATEAMFLLMAWAFTHGYRRYEWKCNALNAPSRLAAQRLGLSFEGVFRQAGVVKGRNRDTAWYAAIDEEWPALNAAFTHWLAPPNFDAHGQQKVRLSALTEPILKQRG